MSESKTEIQDTEEKKTETEICSRIRSLHLGNKKTEHKQTKYFGEFKKVIDLDQYYPSNEIKLAQTKKFAVEFLVKNKPLLQKYVECQQLEPGCIRQVLKSLLQIEDAHTMLPYCSLYQKHAIWVKTSKSKYPLEFKIKVPPQINLDEVLSVKTDEVVFVPLLSTALSQVKIKYPIDLLEIHPHESIEDRDPQVQRHVRTLQKVENKTVYVKIYEEENSETEEDGEEITPPFSLEKPYNIIFRPNRHNFRLQHRALELLNQKNCKYIFPPNNLTKVNVATNSSLSLKIINEQICTNPEQLQAVEQIVAGGNPYAPYIVVGPPGTGKTTTIVEAILQLYIHRPGCHILVTTGSNSASDTVALKICEYIEKHPQLEEQQREPRTNESESWNILRVFSNSWINKIGLKNINPLIKKYANFFEGKLVSPAVKVLQKYSIIVATLCTVGRLRTGTIGDWPFTHVFIDEAGAITEAETLVAITSVNTKTCRVILSGDTKQLGPVVMSQIAAELGLKHSLMERLLERDCYGIREDGTYDQTLQTRLRRNYRSHPEILRLFNHLYYKDELIAEVEMDKLLKWDELKMLGNKKFPIIFEPVYGQLDRSKSSRSSYNKAEVDQVLWIIHKLQNHVDLGKIGVISPYRLQCAKIKQILHHRNLKGIEVGTAELFQGREKPIIIASFVKSFCNLGFVTDPKRLNVILSRAQSLLILIGNPKTLQSDEQFSYLIQECKGMKTFNEKK
ncbi:putative helicase mov-10-B.1 isoform X1 [Anastrepha ludens]|uniref:putative helicase mov-10-B.1 isoform X1 n=2 Tax=Anastrepha ludens TaxID=28586 RepID=UPI0023AFDBDF|nr:putative helicase mov-10-B.1 isoform X1 [Anastrepha ludens]